MYDVVVIGAGPCGCTAASVLSKNGFGVLLLEKGKLPRYKSCSGVLIEKSLRLIQTYFGRSVPRSVCCAPAENRGMVFTDDTGREFKFESRGLNVWRDRFDFWLASLAAECGAVVKDESAVSAAEEADGTVKLSVNGETIAANYVIDCSGAIGLGHSSRRKIITDQTFYQGEIDLDARYFYAYLQPELSGYDAWFNVKDVMLVLGVAGERQSELAKYRENFIAYLKKRHGLAIDRALKTDRWVIRKTEPPFPIDYGSGGILKAGEAAGFLNPMGEGISSALESGYCAAQAIASGFDRRQSVAEEYRRRAAETEDYMIRQWRLVGRMSKKFSATRP